ncbi:hypothetical protein C8R45DRAFT_1111690 [Mycena sanguinolenta]|nr:hypothetical protein C8R45DRAFT_1111690 [Mycena sanguinolenta]
MSVQLFICADEHFLPLCCSPDAVFSTSAAVIHVRDLLVTLVRRAHRSHPTLRTANARSQVRSPLDRLVHGRRPRSVSVPACRQPSAPKSKHFALSFLRESSGTLLRRGCWDGSCRMEERRTMYDCKVADRPRSAPTRDVHVQSLLPPAMSHCPPLTLRASLGTDHRRLRLSIISSLTHIDVFQHLGIRVLSVVYIRHVVRSLRPGTAVREDADQPYLFLLESLVRRPLSTAPCPSARHPHARVIFASPTRERHLDSSILPNFCCFPRFSIHVRPSLTLLVLPSTSHLWLNLHSAKLARRNNIHVQLAEDVGITVSLSRPSAQLPPAIGNTRPSHFRFAISSGLLTPFDVFVSALFVLTAHADRDIQFANISRAVSVSVPGAAGTPAKLHP